jgi:hypothetical protein
MFTVLNQISFTLLRGDSFDFRVDGSVSLPCGDGISVFLKNSASDSIFYRVEHHIYRHEIVQNIGQAIEGDALYIKGVPLPLTGTLFLHRGSIYRVEKRQAVYNVPSLRQAGWFSIRMPDLAHGS